MPNQILEANSTNQQTSDENIIVLGSRDIPSDYNIQNATVHILDQGGDSAVFNEYELELSDETYKYIHNLVKKAYSDKKLAFGTFTGGTSPVQNTCRQILRNEIDVVTGSKNIATHLFNIMKRTDFSESCDLLTATLVTDKGPVVAILKLDYAQGFQHEVGFVDEKISIGITPVRTGLPKLSVNFAAFIKGSDTDGFDLHYIAKAKKTSTELGNPVSNWVEHFLNCEEVASSKAQTLNLVDVAETFISSIRFENAIDAELARRIFREEVLENEEIIISELADKMFAGDAEYADDFVDFAENHNIEDVITIDAPTAVKKLSDIKLKIDKDITLNITREAYNERSRFEVVENSDGSMNIIIKNIVHYKEM